MSLIACPPHLSLIAVPTSLNNHFAYDRPTEKQSFELSMQMMHRFAREAEVGCIIGSLLSPIWACASVARLTGFP
jgi:hypothetical protein